jgi:ABC-type nitrate/sulfonate/bicarbonate transport system ATPase subunit
MTDGKIGEPEGAEEMASAEGAASEPVAEALAQTNPEVANESEPGPTAEPVPESESAPAAVTATESPVVEAAVEVPVVEFSGVSKVFGDGASAFTAIKDMNFKVIDKTGHGEFVSVLGPSGCGKSTILRLIAGLSPQHPPTTGTVKVDGIDVHGPGADRGMVFQDYTSFDHRTVLDNVAFGLECRGVKKKERYERAREWIDKVGLSVKDDADKYPHQLSGGMRQRVAIARTLILHPRIILMDEPFGALDPATRMLMQDNLVGLWRELEATVFLVTHSIEEAVYLGDRIFILSSSPGTILQEMDVPPPDRPAKEMQREDSFQDIVFEIRDTIEQLEASSRAGDD